MPILFRLGRRVGAVLLIGVVALRLLAAEWHSAPDCRWSELPSVPAHAPGFTAVPPLTAGITFTNHLSEARALTNRNLLSGAGLALGDVNGDGRCDLFFCGLDAPDQLYLNLGGWKFTNVTASAFTGSSVRGSGGDSTGAAFADVDGDGDLDLLINGQGHGTRLFLNDGHGHFTDVTEAAGLRSRTGATSLALVDVDGDGDLDLYVANFRPTTVLDQPSAQYRIQTVNGKPQVAFFNGRSTTEADLTNRFVVQPNGQVEEYGQPDVLWRNDTVPGGPPTFTPISWTGGAFLDEQGQSLTEPPRDWGLACRFGDINGDGLPDLYVCNDLWTPDRIWLNTRSRVGEIRFQAASNRAIRANSTFSMGVDFGDLNRDGFVDFMTVDMLSRFHTNRQMQLAGMAPVRRLPGRFGDREQVQRNCLQLGRGDGTFAEVAWQAGVVASEWSWGPILLDVDLDGFEDILVPNGQWRDFQNSDGAERLQAAQRGGKVLSSTDIAELVRSFPKFATPSVAFRNRTGERLGFVPEFEEVGAAWGFTQPGVSQGAALADLDGDGDLDVVMNRLMDAPALYRNEAAGGRIELRLAGSGANPHGLGAVATLRDMSGTAPPRSLPVQRVEFIGGGRYLSGDEAVRTFAAREDANYELKVVWPSGRTTVCSGIKSGRLYEVNEPVSGPIQSSPIQPMPAFIDCSAVLGHRHVDDDFEDTARQPLMPRRLSQLGPGVTWADINGDGHDDLLIGTGKGGQLAVFQGDGRGGFQRLTHAPFNRTQGRDLTGLLALNPGLIFAGAANYEDGTTNGGCIAILDLIGQRTGTSLSGQRSSVGPLAAADLTGDGELQVFVGGRVIPERYPEPATSLLLSTKGGRLAILQRFENLGLVSGACFTDLQGDGRPELVLALEWGPLKIFRTAEGHLVPWDPWVLEIATNSPSSRLLSTYTGFWNSVTAGDFDGDGRLDIVAGNWGRNTQAGHAPDLSAAMVPARMWYGDLSGTGTFDLFETGFRNGIEVPARELPALRGLFPAQAERVPTFSAYARSSLPELFGNLLENARRVDANCLDSVLLLNRGDHFELRRLPDEVQLAPVFGLAVGDADGDGNEDLWVAQGFFATDPMFNRADAGRGVWLYGDGHGGFRADLRSGIAVYGEARGAALADFDEDGRVDLCVAQNGAATTLWRNVGAKPGLRVRLEGPPGNSTAAGAAVRLWVDDRPGPWRERHAGAGYWSCDSPVLVLGSATPPTAAEVRWPGGKTQRYPVGSDTRELKVRPD